MIRKAVPIILVGCVFALLVMSMGGVAAGPVTPTPTLPDAPAIRDGRVNGNDIAAPVAVFCRFIYPDANNTALKPANRYAGVLDRVELWGITDNSADHYFHEIAMVPASTINATPATQGVHVDAEAFGYVLYHNADGSLTIVAPPDSNGSTYRFTWTPGRAPGC